ncbi:MAG: hypothetical protein NTX18_05640 [Cyanobium sp. LacPavin_0818_WC50_MAG_67_9]|nr:hypothetical protein [Cyanobium sp. LacPavin_0818_WC50_MAG_67_9]
MGSKTNQSCAIAVPQPIRALVAPVLLTSLLLPVLQLMRPQLEQRLKTVCMETGSSGNAALAAKLEAPCTQLARPTSQCLVQETADSGRSLAILGDMIRGDLGADSEVVVKRCMAKMLGLPADSLQAVPLKELVQGFAKTRR